MTKGVTTLLFFALTVLVTTGFLTIPVYASNSWGWGSYTATNFTTSTVVGMKTNDFPYWQSQIAWGGPDNGIAFVITVFSPYSESKNASGTANPSWQIGLLVRHNTKYMDTVYENPGDTALTVACSKCSDGTTTHTYQISRITNGWTSYLDGSSVVSKTCTCASDYVDLTRNQEPIVMEVGTGITQSNIDQNFQVSEGVSYYYQASPVGTGTWHSIPHIYVYYTNTNFSCTNTNVGNTNPPSWAAVNSNGFVDNTETGTTTYLTKLSCGNQQFSPMH